MCNSDHSDAVLLRIHLAVHLCAKYYQIGKQFDKLAHAKIKRVQPVAS
jgi:hypothetical protein